MVWVSALLNASFQSLFLNFHSFQGPKRSILNRHRGAGRALKQRWDRVFGEEIIGHLIPGAETSRTGGKVASEARVLLPGKMPAAAAELVKHQPSGPFTPNI